MKAAEIVAQLQALLPEFTELFTTQLTATLVWSGAVITATFKSPHGLLVGDEAVITGAREDVDITSMTRNSTTGDTQAVIVTTQEHDLTTGILITNPATGNLAVEVSGATEDDWNGIFDVDEFPADDSGSPIPNRVTINIVVPPYVAQPTSVTGTPVLHDAFPHVDGVNRVVTVTRADELTFDFDMPAAHQGQPQPAGTIKVHSRPRVTSAATTERAIATYSEREDFDHLWAYVVLGDVTASQGRETDSDAIDEQHRGSWRQRVVQPMSILVMFPATDDVSGADTRDLAEDIVGPFLSCLLGAEFSTGLATDSQVGKAGQPQLQFEGHGIFGYDGALLIHQYAFQHQAAISDRDTVKRAASRAYRDSDITIFPVLSTEEVVPFIEDDEAKLTISDWSHDDVPIVP